MGRVVPLTQSGVLRAVILGCVALLTVACSQTSPERPHEVELESLRVAIPGDIDTVPLRLAVREDLFRAEGLDVEIMEASGEPAARRAVIDGEADVGLMCNFGMLSMTAAGTNFQVQAEAYIAGPGTTGLVTLPETGYEQPDDRPRPVIGVEPGRGLGELATTLRLAIEGIDEDKVRFTELVYDDMIPALRNGDIDAAWLTEPDISRAQRQHGAQVVVDTGRGALTDFPVSSYVAMAEHASKYPRTFAAFRRGLARAQPLLGDRAAVREVLGDLANMDGNTAAMVTLGSYPATTSSRRLQRVADLMQSFGEIDERIDVHAMIAR